MNGRVVGRKTIKAQRKSAEQIETWVTYNLQDNPSDKLRANKTTRKQVRTK